MSEVKLPGGGSVFHMGSQEETAELQRVVLGRHAFYVAYCRSKGWPDDPAKLSFEQIREIREQDGWKNP